MKKLRLILMITMLLGAWCIFCGFEAKPDCYISGVTGYYIAGAQEALDYVNQVRYEACTAGNVPDPRNPSRMLEPSDYVPMKWSNNLEGVAMIRAREAAFGGYSLAHTRPDGTSCFTTTYNGTESYGEGLAWSFRQAGPKSGFQQFYDEKKDWVIQNADAVTGHYTAMINPRNITVGAAAFCSQSGGYTYNMAAEYLTYDTGESFAPLVAVTDGVSVTYPINYNKAFVYIDSLTIRASGNITDSPEDKCMLQLVVNSQYGEKEIISGFGIMAKEDILGCEAININGIDRLFVYGLPDSYDKLANIDIFLDTKYANYCSRIGHSFEAPVMTSKADFTHKGKGTRKCKGCGKTENITIDKVSVNLTKEINNINYWTVSEYDFDINSGKNKLAKGTDYTVESPKSFYYLGGQNTRNCGVSVKVTLKDSTYYKAATKTFKFAASPWCISDNWVKISKCYYNKGKAVKPKVVVKDNFGKKLKQGTDYTIKFSNNKKVGIARVKITMKKSVASKYYGSVEKTFRILAKK